MANERSFELHNGRSGAAITVRVKQQSRKNQIIEILGDGTILIGVKKSKENQDLNIMLVDFLAQILEIDKGDIEIIGGQQGRDKLLSILNVDAETVQEKILRYPQSK